MRTITLGLIGLGYMGQIHLRNAFKLKGVHPIAASDLSKRRRANAQKAGVKRLYSDYQDLLADPDVDAVVISLPTHLHAECAISSAEAGKSLLLEKPLARTPTEGQTIVNTCRTHDVKLMAGYHFRFSPPFRQLKAQLLSGAVGDPQIAYATMIGPGPFFHRAEGYAPRPVPAWWFNKAKTGGGALIDLGSHMINLVRWYFGEVSSVQCFLGHRYNMDYEDYAICLCKMKRGTVANITTGWFSRAATANVEIFGTSKIVSARREASSKILNGLRMLMGLTPLFNLPYYWLLQHFVDCLRNDHEPSPSGNDALNDLLVIAQAYSHSRPIEDAQLHR